MESSGRDASRSPTSASFVHNPLSDIIHLNAKNSLLAGASLAFRSDAASQSHFPSESADVASPLFSEDKTNLPPFDECDLENRDFLSAAAAEVYRMRRARDHVLPRELTGEPAWDMLLALYSEEPAKITLSSICYGSGVPQTTALRWISMLEAKGLVERIEHPKDVRIILLSLTNEGRSVVEQALKVMLRAFRL